MKIGIVTDDGKTVSPHFGMAKNYLVFEVEGGVIKGKEMRPKAWHSHGGGAMHHEGDERYRHGEMLSNVIDCEALVARGMGSPMHEAILKMGIKPYVTNITSAEEVVGAYLNGTLANQMGNSSHE